MMNVDDVQGVNDNKADHEDIQLPGFRFHPTDEELVGFYLKRKVEKKPLRFELIKQIDIYKFDPWDLPSMFSAPILSFLLYMFSDSEILILNLRCD